MNEIKTMEDMILQMEKLVEKTLTERREKQKWENTFIKHQIDKRKRGETFSIIDHIRAMIYSMLSSGASWKRVLDCTDLETGKITVVDEIFYGYEPEELLKVNSEDLSKSLKDNSLASQYTKNQIEALTDNIKTLQKIEKEYGTIDIYYSQIIKEHSAETLVSELSTPRKPYKMKQLGFALTCEYLRNVGYDMPKPDRHICRILGKDYLNLSENQSVKEKEAFRIVSELAGEFNKSNKSIAEVDYILWSYCANGYGEICLKDINKAKCGKCVVNKYCKKRV